MDHIKGSVFWRQSEKGEHAFKSPDIASTVGKAIIESFLESTGERLKVNLDAPDVEFHALLRGVHLEREPENRFTCEDTGNISIMPR